MDFGLSFPNLLLALSYKQCEACERDFVLKA
jgi:hypothetical protein